MNERQIELVCNRVAAVVEIVTDHKMLCGSTPTDAWRGSLDSARVLTADADVELNAGFAQNAKGHWVHWIKLHGKDAQGRIWGHVRQWRMYHDKGVMERIVTDA